MGVLHVRLHASKTRCLWRTRQGKVKTSGHYSHRPWGVGARLLYICDRARPAVYRARYFFLIICDRARAAMYRARLGLHRAHSAVYRARLLYICDRARPAVYRARFFFSIYSYLRSGARGYVSCAPGSASCARYICDRARAAMYRARLGLHRARDISAIERALLCIVRA